jgi:TonB-dependent receptor
MKVELNYGDQLGSFERALGIVFSGMYSARSSWSPGNFFGFAQTDNYSLRQTSDQGTRGVDLGATANVSLRLGPTHTLTLKSIGTHATEEFSGTRYAFLPEVPESQTFASSVVGHQVRYIERTFLQSQLGGSHQLGWLWSSRLDWAVTGSRALRDEPENRALTYLLRLDGRGEQVYPSAAKNHFQWRDLTDEVYSGKVDYELPFSLFSAADALVKVGGYYRTKERDSRATIYEVQRGRLLVGDDPVFFLPPEQLWAPENLEFDRLSFNVAGTGGIPYTAEDRLGAGYAMIDARFGALRVVAGARVERWDLRVEDAAGVQTRDPLDVLGSANITWSFSDAMNLRFAGYQTLARPDPRELTQSPYQSVTGECSEIGTPELVHSRILNADLRWEWYPTPGELVSVSPFYKLFDEPIIQLVDVQSLSCQFRPFNAGRADNLGIEFEARRGLGFLTSALENWNVGLNFTWVTGAATTKRGEEFDVPGELPLQDQSEYLANASLGYANAEAGLDFTVLYNTFTDRLRRYGTLRPNPQGEVEARSPDVYERGRSTVDLKVRKSLGPTWSVSLSGTNLTNQDQVRYQQLSDGRPLRISYANLPVSVSLSAKYRF